MTDIRPDLLAPEFTQCLKERADANFKGHLHPAFIDYVEGEFGQLKWQFTDGPHDGGIDAVIRRKPDDTHMHRTRSFQLVLVIMAVSVLATVSAQAQTYTESVLHSFGNGTDGASPQADLIPDAAGNLYGTTYGGGTYGGGTVFELAPLAGGGWTEKVLYNFFVTGGDGTSPRPA